MTITYSAIYGLRCAWKRAMGDAKMEDHDLDPYTRYRHGLKEGAVFIGFIGGFIIGAGAGIVAGSFITFLGAWAGSAVAAGSMPYLHANYKCGEVQHERKLALEAEKKRLALLPPPPKPLA